MAETSLASVDRSRRRTRFLLSLLPALLIGLAFGLGKIVRDCSLTCNVGYELTPIAIIAVGLLAVPISAAMVRMTFKLGYRRWQVWSMAVIALSFFLFWIGTYLVVTGYETIAETFASEENWNIPVRLIYLGFFVWLGAVATVFAPSIKRTIYKLYKKQDRAKMLAYSTAALILGGLIGGFIASAFVPDIMMRLNLRYELARDTLILGMGMVMLCVIPVILILDRIFPADFALPDDQHHIDDAHPMYANVPKINFRTGIGWIVRDVKLRHMAALIVMRGMAETVLIYLFYWLVSNQAPAINGRTMFFADFYIVLNASTLLLLVFGANRIINRIGLISTLLILPVTLLLGTSYLVFQAIMVVTYILRIADGTLEQALYSQGLDRMVLQVDETQAQAVRPIFQGLIIRIGRSLAAVFLLILSFGLDFSFTQMTYFFLAVLVVWIATVFFLKPHLSPS
ncbi:hypothetical protein ACFLT2_00990 [Acidobacteriota bacterium]